MAIYNGNDKIEMSGINKVYAGNDLVYSNSVTLYKHEIILSNTIIVHIYNKKQTPYTKEEFISFLSNHGYTGDFDTTTNLITNLSKTWPSTKIVSTSGTSISGGVFTTGDKIVVVHTWDTTRGHTGVSYTFTSDTVTEYGKSKDWYQHTLDIRSKPSDVTNYNYVIIYTTSETEFTISSLRTWLINNGYTCSKSGLTMSSVTKIYPSSFKATSEYDPTLSLTGLGICGNTADSNVQIIMICTSTVRNGNTISLYEDLVIKNHFFE